MSKNVSMSTAIRVAMSLIVSLSDSLIINIRKKYKFQWNFELKYE